MMITKQELIEILEQKFNESAVIIGKSFQNIEDKMATKEELRALDIKIDKKIESLESKMDKRFNKLDIKIDNYKGNTDRRIDWLTDEVIKLKKT